MGWMRWVDDKECGWCGGDDDDDEAPVVLSVVPLRSPP